MNNSQVMFREGMCINYFDKDAVITLIKTGVVVITFKNKTLAALTLEQLYHALKNSNLIVKKHALNINFSDLGA